MAGTDWAVAVLQGLGITPTAQSIDFLHMWAGREGVPQSIDHYNWLGTTLKVGPSVGTNAPGVQNYASFSDGVSATVQMLSQSNFAGIRTALASGNPNQYKGNPEVQSEFSKWSGGGGSLNPTHGYTWPDTSARVSGDGTASGGGGGITGALGRELTDPRAYLHVLTFGLVGGTKDQGQGGLHGVTTTATGVLGTFSSVADFLSKVTDRGFAIRVLEVIGGAGMVAIGATLLAKQIGLATAVPGPVGAAASAASAGAVE